MNTTTSLGERNVFVSCELVSKPVDVRLYWVIDDNGTTVSEAQVIHEYWFLIMVSSNFFVVFVVIVLFHFVTCSFLPLPRCRQHYVFGSFVRVFVRLSLLAYSRSFRRAFCEIG